MLHIYKSITLAFFCVEQNVKHNTTSPEWNEEEEQKGEKEK